MLAKPPLAPHPFSRSVNDVIVKYVILKDYAEIEFVSRAINVRV